MLVTNPPYSGEHKVKLLNYLKGTHVPFLLLLPAYTATKSYWRDFTASFQNPIQYIMPASSYTYLHPEGTGKDLPPFYSAWFCGGIASTDVIKSLYSNSGQKQQAISGVGKCMVIETVEEMVLGEWVTQKRLNPKRRNKRKKLG